uniref:Uncharacterized protein n=1 Tax=Malurus cyaneus samueli TaxID=2593467 RepID=A0A8C5TF33_9PASS
RAKPGGSPWECSGREDNQGGCFFLKQVVSSKSCIISLAVQDWLEITLLASYLYYNFVQSVANSCFFRLSIQNPSLMLHFCQYTIFISYLGTVSAK